MKMISTEQSVKNQFAKIYNYCDWQLFKEIAEINFQEAALLKKSAFKSVDMNKQLLIRNIRKRLLIGIGTELLLKAIYLRAGFAINKPQKGIDIKQPFKLEDVNESQLVSDNTFTLNQLIDNLTKVIQIAKPDETLQGLKIAKVFRNKEGHVVTSSHIYDPINYRAIEKSLIELYACVFNEVLNVQFSIEVNEIGKWHVAK